MRHRHRDVATSAWVGFLLATTLARPTSDASTSPGAASRDERGRVPAALAPPAPAPMRLDPDELCVRELRALPGIGSTRAAAIVRARFERGLRGGPASWERIPGIGPKTIAAVEHALERARAARLSSPPRGAYTSAGNRP